MAVARPKAVSRKPARPSKQDDIEIVKATRDIKVHTPAQGFSDEDEEDDDVVLGGEVMDEDMSDDSAAGSSDESDNDQVFDDVPASASLPRGSMAGVANAMSALLNQNMPQVEVRLCSSHVTVRAVAVYIYVNATCIFQLDANSTNTFVVFAVSFWIMCRCNSMCVLTRLA